MKSRVAVCVLVMTTGLLAAGPTAMAKAAPILTLTQPPYLAGWTASSGADTNGRWVTGPGTAPLGYGSAHLSLSTADALEYDYNVAIALTNYVIDYQTYGAFPAGVLLLTNVLPPLTPTGPPRFQVMRSVPTPATGWQKFTPATWEWDCDGDGVFEGTGTIADFNTVCEPNGASVLAVALVPKTGDAYVDAVEAGSLDHPMLYDFEPPQMSVLSTKMKEGNKGKKAMRFVVQLYAPNDDPVTVHFYTKDSNAHAGSDYVASKGTLTIPAGQTSGVIKILIKGDRKPELMEQFYVVLKKPHGAVFFVRRATGSIINDDRWP